LLKLDVEQLKEAVTAPPQSNAAPVANGHIPSLGRQMRSRRLQRVAGAFPRRLAPALSRFLGQRGACEEATSPRAVTSMQPSSRHRARFTDSRPPGLPIGHGQERFFDATTGNNLSVSSMCM
jgi:hypothetical protein